MVDGYISPMTMKPEIFMIIYEQHLGIIANHGYLITYLLIQKRHTFDRESTNSQICSSLLEMAVLTVHMFR